LQLTGCASTEELYAQYDEKACLLPVAETKDRVVVKEVLYRDSLVWEPAVYFDYKKDFLQGRESERLKENLAVLKKYPDLRVVIRGFTDAVGSNRYNQDLAERRVKFVFNYLRGQGIAARRMVNMPLGEEMPFLRSRDEAGDAINRRVELVLTDGSGRPVAYRVESFMDVNNAATEE
nr:OmpA family protein [Gammaproteobacteria bacterium]